MRKRRREIRRRRRVRRRRGIKRSRTRRGIWRALRTSWGRERGG